MTFTKMSSGENTMHNEGKLVTNTATKRWS